MMKNALNLEVQLLLKQGQVEVPCGLIHRGVVEDLNGTIRVSAISYFFTWSIERFGPGTKNLSCQKLSTNIPFAAWLVK